MRPTLHIKRKTITPKLLKKYTLLLIISFPPSFSFPLVFQPLISITNSNALSPVLQFIQPFFFFYVFCQLFVNAPLKFSNHSFRSQIPMHFPLYYSLYNFFFFFFFLYCQLFVNAPLKIHQVCKD